MRTRSTKIVVGAALGATLMLSSWFLARGASAHSIELAHFSIFNAPTVDDNTYDRLKAARPLETTNPWNDGHTTSTLDLSLSRQPSMQSSLALPAAHPIDELDPWTSQPIMRTTPALR